MTKYKLIYFNVRGRGEIIRLIFAEAGISFEDERIDKSDWLQLKPKMPFGQLPVLEIDGQVLPQSRAIAKYLAKEFNLDGRDSLESAFCDALVDCVEDVNILSRPWKYEKDPEKKNELWWEFRDKYFTEFLTKYDKFLTRNATGYFVGDNLTWADLYIFNFIQSMTLLRQANFLTAHPHLQGFVFSIERRPRIRNWLNTRPATDM